MENGQKVVRVQSYFTYPVDAIVLAAGAEGTSTLRIESATDFIWFKSSFWADDDPQTVDQTAATQILPSVDVQINVSGADRNLYQQPLPIPAGFGSGQIPFVLPKPMILLANSEVRFDFVSRETTRDLRIVLALHGLKDFGEMSQGGLDRQSQA